MSLFGKYKTDLERFEDIKKIYNKGKYKKAYKSISDLEIDMQFHKNNGVNMAEFDYWYGLCGIGFYLKKYYDDCFNQSMRHFISSHKKGYADASKWLGEYYYELGTELYQKEDFKGAIRGLEESIDYGNMDAKYQLANIYYRGDGTDIKLDSALILAKEAVENGVSDSLDLIKKISKRQEELEEDYNKALKLYDKKNYNDALPLLLSLAKKGHMEAQRKCGYIYYNGLGVEVDLKEALHWYENAAYIDTNLQFLCGEMYYKGEGCSQDNDKALYWYLLAAKRGHVEAECRYGELAYYAKKTTRFEDHVDIEKESREWLLKSAKSGYVVAQFDCGCRYWCSWSRSNKEKSCEWFIKASEQDFGFALKESRCRDKEGLLSDYVFRSMKESVEEYYTDSTAYVYGVYQYTLGNYEEALKWYEKSDHIHFDRGKLMRGLMYYRGEGKKQNKDLAFECLKECLKSSDEYVTNILNSRDPEMLLIRGEMYYSDKEFTEALEYFLESSKLGNELAGAKYRIMHYNGEGVELDYAKTLKLYEESAKLGNAVSQMKCGDMYYEGLGTSIDKKASLRWYRGALKKEELDGYYDFKHAFMREYDWKDRETEYYIGTAIYRCGEIYYNGDGVKKDLKEAFKWYERAADVRWKYREAQNKCGDMCYNGEGTDINYSNALDWYLSSAKQLDSYGEYKCSEMYFKGIGTDIKLDLALKYGENAEAGGLDGAKTLVLEIKKKKEEADSLYNKAKDLYKKRHYVFALQLFLESANMGDAKSQYYCGVMYRDGLGTKTDRKVALEWFNKAGDQDNAASWNALGDMYYHGIGIKANAKEAAYWYRKAAEAGVSHAQFCLGCMYYNGEGGLVENRNIAGEWFEKAAEFGDAAAKFNCALYYYNRCKGHSIPELENKAEELIGKVIETAKENKDYELRKKAEDLLFELRHL